LLKALIIVIDSVVDFSWFSYFLELPKSDGSPTSHDLHVVDFPMRIVLIGMREEDSGVGIFSTGYSDDVSVLDGNRHGYEFS
jgi:hypothetical protein